MAEKPKSKTKSASRSKAKAAKPAPAAAKPTKKATKATSAAKSVKKSKPAAPPVAAEAYYVSFAIVPAEIHDAPPSTGLPFAEFSSFEAAREHLLDHLLELIEAFEDRLHSVKKIGSFDDYRGLSS
jgi:hypothetical protein